MLTVYGISNCDTIKKTRKWLDAEGIEFQFHDYKKQGCPTSLVKLFLEHFNHTELINTRGTTWRKLEESAKQNITAKTAVTLMSENPSMIKRPLVESSNGWAIGFDKATLKSLVR